MRYKDFKPHDAMVSFLMRRLNIQSLSITEEDILVISEKESERMNSFQRNW